jgi:hypothetical protein
MGPMPMELHGGQSLFEVLHSPPRPIGIITPIFTGNGDNNNAIYLQARESK